MNWIYAFLTMAIALLLTFFWIQMWLADFVNARVNPYAQDTEGPFSDKVRSKIKLGLILAMSLFWAATIIMII